MDMLFYSDTDEVTGRHIVIEEENQFIWAYLTLPNKLEVAQHCFLGSRMEIKENQFDGEEYKKKKAPPPMIKEFSTKYTNVGRITEDDFFVDWYKNENVLLFINEIPFLFFLLKKTKDIVKQLEKMEFTEMHGILINMAGLKMIDIDLVKFKRI